MYSRLNVDVPLHLPAIKACTIYKILQVSYQSATVSLSHKAAAHDMNETKSGDVLARKTPVAYCDCQELLSKMLITLKNAGK